MTRLALAACLAALACGGRLPETRYYQLAAPSGGVARTPAGASLAIEPLETDPAYDDERIVYRLTPYRLDYYHYHRWSAPPGTLVADYLERAFEHSGRFRSVSRAERAAPTTLGGRVIALEEVDQSPTAWVGRVVVELTLTDNATGTVLWSEQYEETEPLDSQSPEGLAKALSLALHRIAHRALPVVADLTVQIAHAQDNTKASPPRAARLKP